MLRNHFVSDFGMEPHIIFHIFSLIQVNCSVGVHFYVFSLIFLRIQGQTGHGSRKNLSVINNNNLLFTTCWVVWFSEFFQINHTKERRK